MGRSAKSRGATETYLKTIFLLEQNLTEVRSIDVANELGVSKPSVSVTVKKLCKEGFLTMGGNRRLVLTESGQKYAASIFERHVIIENYLTDILDVEKKIAHQDACRLEFFLSDETVSKIKEVFGEK